MTDRREFFISLSAATAAVGLGLSSSVAALPNASPAETGDIASRYAAHINGQFRFSNVQNLRDTEAKLVEIVELPSDRRIEQFELVFRAPPGGELTEGIYAMTTPMGDQTAHLVQPLAGRGADRDFAVHFSLLR